MDPEFVYGPSYETAEVGGESGQLIILSLSLSLCVCVLCINSLASGSNKGENWPNEFIHQVKLYQEHKRKKTKLTTARKFDF